MKQLQKSIKREQERLQKLNTILEIGHMADNKEFNAKINLNIRMTEQKLQTLYRSSTRR